MHARTVTARLALAPLTFAALLAACQAQPAQGPVLLAPATPAVSTAAVVAPAEAAAVPDSPIGPAIAAADAALQAIVDRPVSERTFANTVQAIDDVQARFFIDARIPGFMAQVSTDPAERALGRQASADLGNWYDRLYKREDLYRVLKDFEARGDAPAGEGARYLEILLRDFRRSGMDLPADRRARLAEIDEEMNQLGIDFQTNINDDQGQVLLRPEECAGVPQEHLDTLPMAAGLYVVRLKGPNVYPFWDYCDVEDTRRKLSVAYSYRAAGKNVDVLERLIALRAEKAEILGYDNIAAFATEVKMAKEPANVWAFYEDLRPKLRVKAEADFEEYQNAKREHTGDPEATLNVWDISYYKAWLLRERYAVDKQKVKEYFPVDQVAQGIFDVTQDLFGLRYEDITAEAEAAGLLWHEDVHLYRVRDRETGEELGRFFTDLHPREGKYTHAAQFPLEPRKRWMDGTLNKPLVALVCNFTKATADRPALLDHSEVRTFFHEFGHCLHSILTEAEYAEFSGTSVARDFVEAPSQMLENWIWNAEVLGRFAKHYDTGEPLPAEVLDGLIAARNLGSGLSAEGQVFLGMLDFTYHTDPDGELDTTAVRQEVYAATRLFDPVPTPGQASFGHLVGYYAGYYGYLWSLVYAADMFSRFDAEGIMNPQTAREYREKVLARGGTADALDLVRDFLGREPNSDAFLRHLGLTTD